MHSSQVHAGHPNPPSFVSIHVFPRHSPNICHHALLRRPHAFLVWPANKPKADQAGFFLQSCGLYQCFFLLVALILTCSWRTSKPSGITQPLVQQIHDIHHGLGYIECRGFKTPLGSMQRKEILKRNTLSNRWNKKFRERKYFQLLLLGFA